VTGKRPYRCHGCDWRGWSIEVAEKPVRRSDSPAADWRDLTGTLPGRSTWLRPLNLEVLDTPQTRKESGLRTRSS
jgi:hypothetical protein